MTALSSPAYAADSVAVRTGGHDNYTRLVFEWPGAVTYKLDKPASGALTLTFPRAAMLNTGELKTDGNVKSVKQTSSGDAPLALQIDTPPGSKIRDFSAGGKVIIDVYGSGAQAQKPAAPAEQPKEPVKKAEVKKPPAPVHAEVKPEKPVPEKPAVIAKKAEPPKEEAHAAAPVPAPAHEETAHPLATGAPEGDDVITLTSTETAGMAAFRRGGWLWIVRDKPSGIPPQVYGPHKDDLGALEPVEVEGGSAWRVKLPGNKDMQVYGEGGGLVWRVVMTGKKRETHDVEPVRTLTPGNNPGTLLWPLKNVTKVVDIKDPSAGDTIKVVTVARADQYAGAPYSYVDMETLPSMIGLAIVPHVDDLEVKRTVKGAEAGRPSGLTLSTASDLSLYLMQHPDEKKPEAPAAEPAHAPAAMAAAIPQPAAQAATIEPFFDFNRWQMGGTEALGNNQTILLSGLKQKDADAQIQDLITLAKMNLANDRGQEALGFLTLASDNLPAIGDSPEFVALRGAAEALSGKNELGFRDLQSPLLLSYNELDYWRAFALASLEDWQQAAKVMPSDLKVLLGYPQPLLEKMLPKLAETALRAGDPKKADDLQQGKFEDAQKLWTPLLTGKDDMFRVRAGLALTSQELAKDKIKPEQAIDRLEGLRYAWRGDELEAQINFVLGKLYLQQRQYMKGFTIMRDSAGMSPDADIAHEINQHMAAAFKDLLMNDKTISPVDATTLYEEFHELAPSGEEGNKLTQKLAERMASADLLGRAGDLLQKQVDYSLQGGERADVAIRLAGISLLNKDPQRAMAALDKADAYYKSMPPGPERDKKLRESALLRARAVSQQGKTEQALEMLGKLGRTADVSRLRADIAWQAGMWPDASDALQDLIVDENIEDGKALTDYQADLLLNRAVALNLANDRVELATMRERFGERMKATPRASLFDVVTRPRSINVMAEQQTIQKIVGEVDMFKGFLDEYKKTSDQQLNATQ